MIEKFSLWMLVMKNRQLQFLYYFGLKHKKLKKKLFKLFFVVFSKFQGWCTLKWKYWNNWWARNGAAHALFCIWSHVLYLNIWSSICALRPCTILSVMSSTIKIWGCLVDNVYLNRILKHQTHRQPWIELNKIALYAQLCYFMKIWYFVRARHQQSR